MAIPKRKRRSKLVKPELQLKITLAFLSTALVAVLLQSVLFSYALIEPAEPGADAVISDRLFDVIRNNLLITLAVLVPLSLIIGLVVTFRIVGPVHRFETFLRQVMDDGHAHPCVIREGDEFHELCELLNEATEPLRKPHAHEVSEAA